MVPAQVVFLDALPLTQNGKIDRQALLDRFVCKSATGSPVALPRTPTEEKIAAIWSELLDTERIGIDDDVFDLGIRSLQAVKAVTRIRTAFAVDLQLRHLFEQPTVAGQAAVVDELLWLARPKASRHSVSEREEVEL